eukprot:Awhi_evm1s188
MTPEGLQQIGLSKDSNDCLSFSNNDSIIQFINDYNNGKENNNNHNNNNIPQREASNSIDAFIETDAPATSNNGVMSQKVMFNDQEQVLHGNGSLSSRLSNVISDSNMSIDEDEIATACNNNDNNNNSSSGGTYVSSETTCKLVELAIDNLVKSVIARAASDAVYGRRPTHDKSMEQQRKEKEEQLRKQQQEQHHHQQQQQQQQRSSNASEGQKIRRRSSFFCPNGDDEEMRKLIQQVEHSTTISNPSTPPTQNKTDHNSNSNTNNNTTTNNNGNKKSETSHNLSHMLFNEGIDLDSLKIELNEKQRRIIHVVDSHRKLVCFDGRFVHWVRPFSGGDRYSLIFFSTKESHGTPKSFCVYPLQ